MEKQPREKEFGVQKPGRGGGGSDGTFRSRKPLQERTMWEVYWDNVQRRWEQGGPVVRKVMGDTFLGRQPGCRRRARAEAAATPVEPHQ